VNLQRSYPWFLSSGQVVLGYGLVASVRGAGLAKEAVRRARQVAAEHGALLAAVDTDVHNRPSKRVLEKAGLLETSRDQSTIYFSRPLVQSIGRQRNGGAVWLPSSSSTGSSYPADCGGSMSVALPAPSPRRSSIATIPRQSVNRIDSKPEIARPVWLSIMAARALQCRHTSWTITRFELGQVRPRPACGLSTWTVREHAQLA
jgi:hypothetical protein